MKEVQVTCLHTSRSFRCIILTCQWITFLQIDEDVELVFSNAMVSIRTPALDLWE